MFKKLTNYFSAKKLLNEMYQLKNVQLRRIQLSKLSSASISTARRALTAYAIKKRRWGPLAIRPFPNLLLALWER